MQWSRDRQVARAALVSFALHAAGVLLLVTLLTSPDVPSFNNEVHSASLTYVHASTKGGGGGGGARPRAAATAPAETRTAQPEAVVTPTMMPVTIAATLYPVDLPGTMTGLSAPVSLAPAGPGGGGTQPGGGAGDGKGQGVGPGSDKGTGGGDEYQVGDDVTVPQVIFEKRPTYTSDALLARIQGVVEIEAVVMANGSVARPRVVRSLDRGLDQRAIEAVIQWRFKAGRRRDTNQPVNVIVRIHLTFVLR